MAKSQQRRFTHLLLEVLEDRCNPSPTLIANLTLPGAGSVWDYTFGPFNASPVVADLDGDGQQEILTPGGDGQLYAYKYNRGSGQFDAPRLFSTGQFKGQIQSTPVVTDLPSGRAVFAANSAGYVFGWNARSGGILPGWPVNVHGDPNTAFPPDGVYGSLAAGDLDGDGIPEIVATSFNHEVTALHADGSVMWRFNNDDTIFSGVAIGDLNRDGKLEVVVGGDSSPSQFYWSGGRVNVLSWDGHREWVKRTDQVIWSSPILADLRGDGSLDVVVGTGYFYPSPPTGSFVGNVVYALDPQGNDLPGWPYVTDGPSVDARPVSSPAVADLEGNGTLDVVIGAGRGQLHAIRPNGQKLWSVQAFTAGNNLWTSPIIADTHGSGLPDVVIGANDGGTDGVTFRGFDGKTGTQVWGEPSQGQPSRPHYAAAAVGHMKGDSSYQMVVIAHDLQAGTGKLLSPSFLEIYNLDPTGLRPPWGQLRQDGFSNAVSRSTPFATALSNILYKNALGRSPSGDELANGWLPLFVHSPSLRPLILGIVGSGEARAIFINGWYQAYLNRGPEPGGLQAWQNVLAHGLSYAFVQANILGSPEAFSLGGGTNPSWVVYLYQKLLGRTPNGTEQAGWVNALNAGQLSRSDVVKGFLLSQEDTEGQIIQWYRAYQPGGLSSPPADTLAAAGWDLRRGRKTEEQVLADILTSNGDYVTTQQEGAWLRAAYQDVLQRPASPPEVVAWLRSMEAGTPLSAIASAISHSQEHNAMVVTSYYQKLLGRTPAPAERDAQAAALTNGASRVGFINGLVLSDEYFARAGSTGPGFVNKVFNDLLGRAPSASEVNFWLSQPGNFRNVLANGVLFGAPQEFYQNMVSGFYLSLLRRLPSTPPDMSRLIQGSAPFGGQGWVNALLAGTNPADVETGILSSGEYLAVALNKSFWLGARWLS
jgi:hypothetical protein